MGGQVCANVSTLIKNVQPDLEPGDFRFAVKAHLCTDGQGTSTTRTAAEVRTIMSDVTKVLSQCGILVTTIQTVTTVVPGYLLDLGTVVERDVLFDIEDDDTAIDVYFVQHLETGASGDTLSPFASGFPIEAGVAIPDIVGPLLGGTPLKGQNAVRTVAHEISHYLLNHYFGDNDHRDDDENLMYDDSVDYKRDMDQGQCLEMRSNFGVD